jgi:hypothetical protein
MDGAEKGGSPKATKISQADIPSVSLENAVRVARGLYDEFAGGSAAPHDVAFAIDISPTSSAWRVLSGAAVAYGLTAGGPNAPAISLNDLGRRIVAPTEEGEDAQALLEAVLKPRVLREFFAKYDRAKFPRDEIAQNVLISMGVPNDRAAKTLEIVKENGRFAGLIRESKTGPFVALATSGSPLPGSTVPAANDDFGGIANEIRDGEDSEFADVTTKSVAPEPTLPPAPKQIFVAHGKNHQPLEALKKILDQFKIPYKVAVDEPNAGRPISRKVAQLMRECSAGIFIFTGDEKFSDATGNEIYRPSENVAYELGAASVLWENKIVILKEAGVTFPSDYKDLGYIEFEPNGLANHALDLLKELIALDFVRVQAA